MLHAHETSFDGFDTDTLGFYTHPDNRGLESSLGSLANQAHAIAKNRGWWDAPRNEGELIALMHSELSELLEAYRKSPSKPSEHCAEITAAEEEAADVIIRLLDFACAAGMDLDRAVRLKMAFNLTRPKKHGKAF